MSIAIQLAERIAAIRFEHLPPEAIHWAKVGILDTVGVTLAGAGEDASRRAGAALGAAAANGPSLVFGSARRVDPLSAALLNGVAAHALDYDDCSNSMGGHPSAPLLAALIALAEQTQSSGREILTAYVAGFETETRIGRGVHLHHYEKGWHPTATLGVFGAAAACAKLLALEAEQTAAALSIAASFSSGIKANFGSMVKPLHVGHCARNGLYAALLARAGYDSGAEVFEHKQGFLEVFNGAGTYDVARMLEDWGNPFDLVAPGIAIKQYPCCASTHSAVDCMLALREAHGLRAADVARIESWTHKRRLAHTNRPHPRSALDAKFSVQYCLARALLHGGVSIDHFEGDAWRDPAVQALLPTIHADVYTEAQFPADNHYGAEIRVTRVDGRVVSGKIDQAHGRSTANPLSAQMLQAKFTDCAARVLSVERSESVFGAVQRFEQLPAIRALTVLLEPASAIERDRAVA
jgi:2-methylcitrate dehydratase PrpD